jgi:hypothetical protein
MDLIFPIYQKRRELESRIDETWEMLGDQSAKAAARAEQTMLSVRNTFDLSRDLGSVRRYFGSFAEDIRNAHDLSQQSDWWNLPQDQQSKLLRDYWRNNLVPRDISLTQESQRSFESVQRELEEPFLSTRKKRVFVTSARQEASGWHFRIPPKSYEVWTLLCWHQNHWIDDFILPQRVYTLAFARIKKQAKDKPIHLRVWKFGETWKMEFADLNMREAVGSAIVAQAMEPIDITELRGNYEPLQ